MRRNDPPFIRMRIFLALLTKSLVFFSVRCIAFGTSLSFPHFRHIYPSEGFDVPFPTQGEMDLHHLVHLENTISWHVWF